MSSIALLIVLAAAVCHASWNVLAHGASRIGIPFLWLSAVSSTVLWAVAVPFTGGIGSDDLAGFALAVTVTGVVHVGYGWVLQQGYRAGRLSTVYTTARGTGPTISVLVALALLGESVTWIAALGVAAILAGVVMAGIADRGPRVPVPGPALGLTPVPAAVPERWSRLRSLDKGLLYGLLTGVVIAAYTVWDTAAIRIGGYSPVAYMVGCTFVEIIVYGAFLGRRRSELRPVLKAHWPRVLLFGVLSPLAYILILAAVKIAPVALVAPLREVSVVLVSLYGVLVLKEGNPARRMIAAAVVVAGVFLISW